MNLSDTILSRIIDHKPIYSELAKLLLRFLIGGLFVYHGYVKMVSFDQLTPYFPDVIGIGIKPTLMLVITIELVGGIFVMCGLVTRFFISLIFCTMAVAYFIIHINDAFESKELAFVFMVLSIIVFFLGSGHWSLDNLIFRGIKK